MRSLATVVCLFVFINVFSQKFNGTIFIRDNSMLYLNQVYITNLSTQKTVLADYAGDFSIAANVGDVIRFTSIVTERKDIKVTQAYLDNKRALIELGIAYREIQEVVINRFRPTGNFKVDVLSIIPDKRIALANKIGLPAPKTGKGINAENFNFKEGAIGISISSIYNSITGEKRKQERLSAYENMTAGVSIMRQYFGDDYFIKLKIPKNLIDNFLQFVYTSDNLKSVLSNGKYAIAEMSIEKYLPIYLKRLQTSNLQTIIENQ